MLVAAGGIAIAFCASSEARAPIMASLLLNGAGVGLFQVAYTDVIVAALPRHSRGVAGSLSMVTRTFGVVTAASVLTSAIDALERRRIQAGDSASAAFAGAFESVFVYSAATLGVLFLAACLRRR
jgi:hypothetical protein